MVKINRAAFSRLLWLALLFAIFAPAAANPAPKTIGERFSGETLIYDLDFMLFSKVAQCEIMFMRNPDGGGYLGILTAYTKGLANWVTQPRRHTYRAYMEEVESGQRLRTWCFEKLVVKGEQRAQYKYWLNYKNRRVEYLESHQNRPVSVRCYDIPPGVVYDDIISGFYNFRAGVYGTLASSRDYTINTTPINNVDTYNVYTLNPAEETRRRRSLGWHNDGGFLLKVLIDKQIFGTKTGQLWGLLDKDALLLTGLVEDVIGFGDVEGQLRQVILNGKVKKLTP